MGLSRNTPYQIAIFDRHSYEKSSQYPQAKKPNFLNKSMSPIDMLNKSLVSDSTKRAIAF
jgi:hypothetical protein